MCVSPLRRESQTGLTGIDGTRMTDTMVIRIDTWDTGQNQAWGKKSPCRLA
jgi:hypothetical protein